MLGGDVVDQLLNQHGLTHAGAAEQANLAALGIGGQQVNDLDAGLKDVHHGTLVLESRGLAVNGPLLPGLYRPLLVDGITQDIEHTAQHALAHGHGDGGTGGSHLHATAQALTGREHDAADRVAAHMLRNLHHLALAVQLHLKSFLDLRQGAVGEGHVYHRSHDLYNGSFVFVHIAIPFRAFIHLR